MYQAKRIAVMLVVLLTTVGCDQATKSMAQTHLSSAEPRAFLNGLFWLRYAENPGAFLSFGATLPPQLQGWFFTVFVAIILAVLFVIALRTALRGHPIVIVALALFLGGGIGNLIDRLTNSGRVIDFMHITVGSLRTGIFNVADMALLGGVLLLGIYSYRTRPPATSQQTPHQG
jgi:signal peptidase II